MTHFRMKLRESLVGRHARRKRELHVNSCTARPVSYGNNAQVNFRTVGDERFISKTLTLVHVGICTRKPRRLLKIDRNAVFFPVNKTSRREQLRL